MGATGLRQRTLTEEEIDILLAAATKPGGRAALRLALAGLRSAELAALRHGDLHVDVSDATDPRVIVAVRSKLDLEQRRLKITGVAASDVLTFMDAAGRGIRFDLPTTDAATPGEPLSFRTFRHTAAARLLRGPEKPPDEKPAAD